MQKILKRDGQAADFVPSKITNAILKAMNAVGEVKPKAAEEVTKEVVRVLGILFKGENYPTVEQVQDFVEQVLIEKKLAKVAKAYILYRQKRADVREQQRKIMGSTTNLPLSLNALQVLAKRYLRRDQNGKIIETPEQMWRRIADNIAIADGNYPKANVEQTAEMFYDMMANLEFLPNTPTIMNAGTELQQLSACFVLPVDDSIDGIFDAVKHAALIHKSGGGTGFSFSRLRPRDDVVRSTAGVSSGPISFMKVFDVATDVVKQGGRRRGANMGILRVDHPDILDFITMKADMTTLQNFNISVAATDVFMQAVVDDAEYELINPHNKKVVKKLPARHVFELILDMAWRNGDPGLIFIDTINKNHPARHVGLIESTNPCGEQPLLAYESCNLGSINMNKMLNKDHTDIDWEKFEVTIKNAAHFLDNVIDMNNYPLKQIEDMTRHGTRKIGLGIMGFADMLFQLGIRYDSPEGVAMAERVMKFIYDKACKKSQMLAETRGCFPMWDGSEYQKKGIKMRNACVTTVAPTGTIGMIAEASGGIEPAFAITYIKNVMDGTELVYVNQYFEDVARKRGFYSEELMRDIAQVGSIQGFKQIPEDVRTVFVTAQDIAPIDHIRLQAAVQQYSDSAVSKTINFPEHATIKEIEEGYIAAWKMGCKGVTVYRDKSRDNQVMNIGKVHNKRDTRAVLKSETILQERAQKSVKSTAQIKKEKKCPECQKDLVVTEGCVTCPACSFSACSV